MDYQKWQVRRFRCTRVLIPMAGTPVTAGFPSPADDYREPALDLGKELCQNEDATFSLRVAGDSMTGIGIMPGDRVVVDRSLDPHDGSVVIAVVNNEFTLKTLRFNQGVPYLMAENPKYPPIVFSEGDEMSIWGVVTFCLKKFV